MLRQTSEKKEDWEEGNWVTGEIGGGKWTLGGINVGKLYDWNSTINNFLTMYLTVI